jgi:radical SAM enzyme (TIGR01210 family)
LPEQDPSAWINAQRPPRAALDPFKPHAFFLEEERAAAGHLAQSAVILLTNKECPWRCLMCDLWKHALPESVPAGSIPRQIEYALEGLGCRPEQLKLYNSGSFFDHAAIPPADYAAIARSVSFARHVVVESHPRLVAPRVLGVRDLLSGSLEVAMGLETVHPRVFPRLNKRFDLADFARAAGFLRGHGIAVRAFILVKPPFVAEEEEAVEWAVKSAEFAFQCGAEVVSCIPTRLGNGALERLREAGEFSPPRLSTLERTQMLALGLRQGRVFADTWDLAQFSSCPDCLEARRRRLDAANRSQEVQPLFRCAVCNGI